MVDNSNSPNGAMPLLAGQPQDSHRLCLGVEWIPGYGELQEATGSSSKLQQEAAIIALCAERRSGAGAIGKRAVCAAGGQAADKYSQWDGTGGVHATRLRQLLC